MKQTTDTVMVNPPRLTEQEFRRWLERFHGVERVQHNETAASDASEMETIFGRLPTKDGRRPNVSAWWDNGRGRRHRYTLETRLGVSADDVVRWLVDAWARKQANAKQPAMPITSPPVQPVPEVPDLEPAVNGSDQASPAADRTRAVVPVIITTSAGVHPEPTSISATPATVDPVKNGRPARRRRSIPTRPPRPAPTRVKLTAPSLVDRVYRFVAGRSTIKDWRVRWLDQRRLRQRFGPTGQAAYRALIRRAVIIEAVRWNRSLVLIVVCPPACR